MKKNKHSSIIILLLMFINTSLLWAEDMTRVNRLVQSPEFQRRVTFYELMHGEVLSQDLQIIWALADKNEDNQLTWDEVEHWTDWSIRVFTYQENLTALHPQDFYDSMGGDCEDWAIWTAQLLRFYGHTSYVGIVKGNPSGSHAVALWYQKMYPGDDLLSFHVTGNVFPEGYYIPIDYDIMGGLSDAAQWDSLLEWIYYPGELPGRRM